MQICPLKKAKAIFSEFRSIVRQKENSCFMFLKYPPPSTECKTISKQEMIKWSEYDFSDEADGDFLKWAVKAMQYLIVGQCGSDIQIKIDEQDLQWIVGIRERVVLVMRIASIDWATIEEELKGTHFKKTINYYS